MESDRLMQLCETGAEQLMRTEYLEAIETLGQAEQLAWDAREWDTLSRLYLPLQEARRQARQRCGEGAVAFHVFVGPGGFSSAELVLAAYPHGQLVVSGPASVGPAVEVRRRARRERRYVDAFLGAQYLLSDGPACVALIPLAAATLPDATPRSLAALRALLPAGSVLLDPAQLPAAAARGNAETFAQTMALWEQLHGPFLIRADAEPDRVKRMARYREVLQVDPACELAHQKLAAVAREMSRVGER